MWAGMSSEPSLVKLQLTQSVYVPGILLGPLIASTG
jgi:hypothetical protein